MKPCRLIGLLLFIVLANSFADRARAGECSAPVRTAAGPVVGIAAETAGVCAWLGMPYATPPVGDRRWRRPEPAAPWGKPLKAEKFGERCAQFGLLGTPGKTKPRGSENCLYLNVYSPDPGGKAPVMVWIHGGGLMSGSGGSALYTGDRLAAAQDVVVVTINYRLGVFGFLAHPGFREEDSDGSVGGYGMMDQIAALKWVRQNIAAFGGDPDNVTIFGESAGGWSVCQLMASPAAKGLFHRAIQQSGNCNQSRPLGQGFAFGKDFADKLGCGSTDCLRAKPADEIMSVTP